MANEIANEREAIFAEEAFVVDVQIILNKIMNAKGFSRADLARSMNVSRARITQIFSDDCKNFTVRLLARAMHALGETPEVTSELCMMEMHRKWEREFLKLAKAEAHAGQTWDDETDACEIWKSVNDNRSAGLARHYEMRMAA